MIEFVVSYLVLFFTTMVYVICCSKCVDVKLRFSWKNVIGVLFLNIIIMINNLIKINVSFKTIICFVCIMLACKLWTKISFKRASYYSLVISVLSILIELITSKILAISFTGFNQINTIFFAKTLFTICLVLILYFIISIPIVKKGIMELEKVVLKYIRYDFLLLVFLIIANSLLTQYNFNYHNTNLYMVSVIILILTAILFSSLLKSDFTKEKLKIKNDYLNESIKNYEQIADDYAELRHNLNADFMAISSVANKKAQAIIDEVIKKYNVNYNWVTHISNIPKGLQGILCIKLSELKKYKINVEVKSKVNKNIMHKITDKYYTLLCDFMDISINNALEATKNSQEKSIFIDLEEEENYLKLKVMNTFDNVLDLDKIGNKHYSTKKRNFF